ncbi:hypothetical protein [Streptomyces lydicus]|uniref:hypothetical protein n=1 Tax=Streptomyces lydicus TaxID=47763 RepID=UPI0037AC6BA2
MIGAMLPSPDVIETSVAGPSSISAAGTHMGASLIQNRLLPQHQEAIFSSRLTAADDDLRWAQETYEPGDVVEPHPRELASRLDRFLDRAPELIAHLRRPNTPLTAHEAAFLDYFEATLGQAQHGGGDAMPLWLTEGEQLIEVAQAAPTRQTTVTRPATPTAVPAPPHRGSARDSPWTPHRPHRRRAPQQPPVTARAPFRPGRRTDADTPGQAPQLPVICTSSRRFTYGCCW